MISGLVGSQISGQISGLIANLINALISSNRPYADPADHASRCASFAGYNGQVRRAGVVRPASSLPTTCNILVEILL